MSAKAVPLLVVGSLLVGLVCGATGHAATSLEPVGSVVGLPPLTVTVEGDYAYCAASTLENPANSWQTEVAGALEVFSIADPQHPALAGLLKLAPAISEVLVRGDYAYLVAGNLLKTVDVSNRMSPEIASSAELPVAVHSACLGGDVLYVSDFDPLEGPAAIHVFSLADPAVPVEVGSYSLTARRMAASGNILYVAAVDALVVLEVSDPAAPHEVGRTQLIAYDNPAPVIGDIAVAGDVACVASNQLFTVDISNPTAPTQLACYPILLPDDIQPLAVYGVQAAGGYAYATASSGLTAVVDVTAPGSPVRVGYLDLPTLDVAVAGENLVVAGGATGLHVLSLADPAAPQPAGKADTPAFTHKVKLPTPRSGPQQYVYGAGWGQQGMTVLDVSQPEAPRVVAARGTSLRSLLISEGYAYVGGYGLDSMLSIYHVSDPTAPQQVHLPSGFPALSNVEGLAKRDGRLYISNENTLTVADVTDPANPVVKGSLGGLSSLRNLALDATGRYTFAAAGDMGLRVIDVSDPAAPQSVATVDTPDWASQVQAAGQYVYLGCAQTLRVFEVSDPTAPQEVAAWTCPGLQLSDIEIVGSYLYLADSGYGLRVLGISDPQQPVEVKSCPLPLVPATYGMGINSGPSGVTACDGYIYVADFGWGVYSFLLEDTFPDVAVDSWATDAIERCVSAAVVSGYPNGNYGPEVVVTRDQMAAYVARALAGGDADVPAGPEQASFSDVAPDNWAYRYVEYAKARGVVQGYDSGRYRPDEIVDRGQMAVYLARALAGGDEAVVAGSVSFADVTPDWWAYRHVTYLAERHVTAGYPDRRYHPEYAVSRDQMAVYMTRAFHLAE